MPGSRAGALFPCDEADAAELARRIDRGATGVAIVFGWERPGPGLEYAAWIAAHRSGVRVTAIDGDGTLERRFGPKATAWLRQLYESRGARLLEGRVEASGTARSRSQTANAWLPRSSQSQRRCAVARTGGPPSCSIGAHASASTTRWL